MITIGKKKIKACKDCGKVSDDLSVRKLCSACAIARMREAHRQIAEKNGPIYEKYKANILAKISESD